MDGVDRMDGKMDGLSADVMQERLDALKKAAPEVFADGRIDAGALSAYFGKGALAADEEGERYRIEWSGKKRVFEEIARRTSCTLTLDTERSGENAEQSGNIFIEGENMEALRVLQKAYHGQVKMIYIDPPYNTGNDFVYHDDFSVSEDDYCEDTCDVDANGHLAKAYKRNAKDGGRYHSDWLSMMYPRLYLARNLLRDDGVIFVSIDDNEVHNLRMIMNEIFGEENFITQLIWEKGRKNDAKFFSVGHEYMMVYGKSVATLREEKIVWREEKPGAREIWQKYEELRKVHENNDEAIEKYLAEWYASLPKNHPAKKWSRYKRVDANGPWRDRDISWPGGGGPRYDVVHPISRKPCVVPERGWIYASPDEMKRMIQLGLVEFREDHTKPPFRKAHIRPITAELEIDQGFDDEDTEDDGEFATQVRGSYFYKQSQVSVKYLRELLAGKIFNNPKDHEEIMRLISYVMDADTSGIVLDFFAGSGTTAHAVMAQNAADGGNRRYVCVQLPEETPEGSEARKAGYGKISDIAIERINRAAKKVKEEHPEYSGDLGMRVYRITDSHFPQWHARGFESAEALEQAVMAYAKEGPKGSEAQRATEILLKLGYPPTTLIEKKDGWLLAAGKVALILSNDFPPEKLMGVLEAKPETVVVLEKLFRTDDDKVNFSLRCKEADVIFQAV